MFGYFSSPNSDVPDFDPGFVVDCPVCHRALQRPVCTVSLMVPRDTRSYFYRMHKACGDSVSDEIETEIDSLLVDAIYRIREQN